LIIRRDIGFMVKMRFFNLGMAQRLLVASCFFGVALLSLIGCASKFFPETLVLYTRVVEGDQEIFVMNADGSNVRQLTYNGALDTEPTWSPDGEQIAYSGISEAGGADQEIFVMNADGSNVRQLTANDDRDTDPAWSPNGKQLAYVSDRSGLPQIFVLDLGTGRSRPLVGQGPDRSSDQGPEWSPDGQQIVFFSDRFEDVQLFVVNVDGSGVVQLTNRSGTNFYPAWSPSGQQIAFSSDSDGDFELIVMNADGSETRQVTDNDEVDLYPLWSVDGERIVFLGGRRDDLRMFSIKADGSEKRKLDSSDLWFDWID